MQELNITGHIPSKKNLLKLTRSGRGYYDRETKERLNEISDELGRQWAAKDRAGNRVAKPPLVHPALGVIFYVTTGNSDRDNKWTTIQDALVDAGVMKDDCIALNNGYIIIGQAYMSTTVPVGARVFIEETGSLDRIVSRFKNLEIADPIIMSATPAKDRPQRRSGLKSRSRSKQSTKTE